MQPHHNRVPYFPTNLEDYAPWVPQHGLLEPYGYCQCGCGQLAPIAIKSAFRLGWKRQHPKRFINHHNARIENPGALAASRPAEERFWEKVDKRGPDECWIWKAPSAVASYGRLGIGYRKIPTHRFSYELHYGPIPKNLYVLHKCDARACVNPAHLFLGTKSDNTQDMIAKGRNKPPRGERNGSARLTAEQVLEIRKRHSEGERQVDLAAEYGVDINTIGGVVHRVTWRHI